MSLDNQLYSNMKEFVRGAVIPFQELNSMYTRKIKPENKMQKYGKIASYLSLAGLILVISGFCLKGCSEGKSPIDRHKKIYNKPELKELI